jgi:hypothetical protein
MSDKQEEYFNNLFTQLSNLESKLGEMDQLVQKINSLETKFDQFRPKTPEEKQELLKGENGAMYEYIQEIEDWKNKITFSNPIVDFCIINDYAFILNRNTLYCYDLTTYPNKNITKLETKLKDMVELIKTNDNRIVVVSADSYELIPLIQ